MTAPSIALAIACMGLAQFAGNPALAADEQPAEQAQPLDQQNGWHGDPIQAFKDAASRQRDALVWFTKEDDDASNQLEASLVESLAASAESNFVLCRLRYPARSYEKQAQSQWYIAWADRFQIPSIPSVVLVDSKGRAYGQIAAQTQDVDAWSSQIQALITAKSIRDDAELAAEQAQGIDKAKHLDQALQQVGPFAATEYRGWVEDVVKLDPNNEAGLIEKYAPLLHEKTIDEVIQGEVYPLLDSGRLATASRRLEMLAGRLEWLSVEQEQKLSAFRGQLLIQEGKQEQGVELLNQAMALDPDSSIAEQIQRALEIQTEEPTAE